MITGGAIGEMTGNPFTAFFLAILSHYILDLIPHFDNFLENGKWSWKQIVFTSIDLLVFIIFWIHFKPAITLSSPFWWGAFGGLAPDLIDNVPIIKDYFLRFNWAKKYHVFHEKLHWIKPNMLYGFLTQAVVISLATVLYLVVK